jgi:hypothetical protein
LGGETCTDPTGQEADADVVDDALGFVVKDGAHFQVALEFAKRFLDFKKVLVMALDVGGIGLLRSDTTSLRELDLLAQGFWCRARRKTERYPRR